MFRPFVPHHIFCPVHRQVGGLSRPVFMESWQLLYIFSIPGHIHMKQVSLRSQRWNKTVKSSPKNWQPHGDSGLLTPHLMSCMTSFSAWSRLSVVIEEISNSTPTPLLAILLALSGWSPPIGIITMGTPWHSPSKTPCDPACVMKARAPECANIKTCTRLVEQAKHWKMSEVIWYVTHSLTEQIVLRHPAHYLHVSGDVVRNLTCIPPYHLSKEAVSQLFFFQWDKLCVQLQYMLVCIYSLFVESAWKPRRR